MIEGIKPKPPVAAKPKPPALKAKPKKTLKMDEMSTGAASRLARHALTITGSNLPAVGQPEAIGHGPHRPTAAAAPAQVAQDRAAHDARSVQAAYDSALKSTHSAAQAADAAAKKLKELIAAHPKDKAYANQLIRAAKPTLDELSRAFTDNISGGKYRDGKDKSAIKDTIRQLCDAANGAGPVGTYAIAQSVARAVPNKKDLYHVDDGFYDYADSGGKSGLAQATYNCLQAQGKGDAAHKLANRHKGWLESAVGAVGGFLSDAVHGAEKVGGWVGDASEGVLHVAAKGVDLAVDAAKGTVDAVGDAAHWGADKVGHAVKYAVENGLKLAGPLLSRVRGLARDAIDKGLRIDSQVAKLHPGDALEIGGHLHAQLGIGLDASANLEVRRERDGSYTVSGAASLAGDIGVGGSASLGGEGKASFSFKTAAEAQKAAKILAAGAMGAVALGTGAGSVLAPALLPSLGDLSFLKHHLSAVELGGTAGAKLAAAFGVEAGVKGTSAYELTFKNGKPDALVRKTEVELEAQGGGSLAMLESGAKKLGIPAGASASGSIDIETRIPLKSMHFSSLAQFLADPAAAATAGHATNSVTVGANFEVGEGQGGGAHAELTIDGVDSKELRSMVSRILTGHLSSLVKGVGVDVSRDAYTYHDVGQQLDFDATIAGQGIKVEGHDEIRRIDRRL